MQGQEHDARRFLQRMRDDLGLVSAYHHCSGEVPGPDGGPMPRGGRRRQDEVAQRIGIARQTDKQRLSRCVAALVLEVKGDFCHDIRQRLVELGREDDCVVSTPLAGC